MQHRHIQLVTGRFAAPVVRQVAQRIGDHSETKFTVTELPITVAALMSPRWVAKHLSIEPSADLVLLPGYCQGDLGVFSSQTEVEVCRGPCDILALPEYLGQQPDTDYGGYDIEILAEINHAPQRKPVEIVSMAQQLATDGADIIDIGCTPGHTWQDASDTVRRLRDAGLRVSIDSFNPREIAAAVEAGAELVLSVNQTNCHAATDWGCEVVAIPDEPATLAGFDKTIDFLQQQQVRFRIDPILEPIGCGFMASLHRYHETRRRYPEQPMMMGIGNVTELTDVDSAGINVLLLGVCEELHVKSVLTTQVIPWARSSVRECDLARRLVHYAVTHGTIPKHREPNLVMLRDPHIYEPTPAQIDELKRQITDRNFRIHLSESTIHLFNRHLHVRGDNPYDLFDALIASSPDELDPSHAFYLGFELAKATTALTLGKQYRQDEALTWGMLTRHEKGHRGVQRRENSASDSPDEASDGETTSDREEQNRDGDSR